MFYHRRKVWELPGLQATPESVVLDRRSLIKVGAAGIALVAAQNFVLWTALAAGEYPAKRNEAYQAGRDVTPEDINSHYNNFYEFGMSKDIHDAAQALKTHPWTIAIDGLVEKPRSVGVDDLVKTIGLEERLYRHRCVEAWSMTVPWTGFPLRALVDLAKPLSGAKFVRFETFKDSRMALGQRQFWYPWPYTEGLTMAEAVNDLAFMVTGAYGKPLDNSFGAPIRVHLPWKYGFKSAKSIVKITFTDEKPKTFWESLAASEYGFWANVNPAVSHPRWSQATEEVLGTHDRIPTQIFNGYGEQVAGLYAGMPPDRLYM
jgi:sulfoxide reductase catalytic subunit YedY